MRTTYLDQFTDDHADRVLDALDRAGIGHWEKRSGQWTRLLFAGDWGVRVFVDADRIEEARAVAARVLQR